MDYGPPRRDLLEELQRERLAATLAHAHDHSPFYRRAFDEAGVAPNDLRSLDDLCKFPFTTKADFRGNYPFGMFAVPMDRVARIHASSGSTGQPTVVGYTRSDIDTWARLMARSIHAAGGRPGMKVHIAYGYGLFTADSAPIMAPGAQLHSHRSLGSQTERRQLIRRGARDLMVTRATRRHPI